MGSSRTMRSRPVTEQAIRQASARALAPSYMPALATSMPVSSHTSDWNSKAAWSVPWLVSGWDLGEQLIDRSGADGGQHGLPVFVGERDVGVGHAILAFTLSLSEGAS